MKTEAAHQSTPRVIGSGKKGPAPGRPVFEGSAQRRNAFLVMVLDMSWRLAVVVLIPIIGGAELDKHFGTRPLWTLVGVGVAFAASAVVMWRSAQAANRLPVPKLTAAQRRAIRKSYEEDDD